MIYSSQGSSRWRHIHLIYTTELQRDLSQVQNVSATPIDGFWKKIGVTGPIYKTTDSNLSILGDAGNSGSTTASYAMNIRSEAILITHVKWWFFGNNVYIL